MSAPELPLFARPVALLLAGSSSDLAPVLECERTLGELGIPCEIRVASAHRTPELAIEAAQSAEKRGFLVLIAFAGMSAQLAGVAAAHTRLPVIGVPLSIGALGGIDAAVASLQMPPGTPVAVVAIDGARNAALLAARMLGLPEPRVRERLSSLAERERERYDPERIAAEIERRRRERS
jgi:5-(carboxyamino)imidazole ribonucleotide mutase